MLRDDAAAECGRRPQSIADEKHRATRSAAPQDDTDARIHAMIPSSIARCNHSSPVVDKAVIKGWTRQMTRGGGDSSSTIEMRVGKGYETCLHEHHEHTQADTHLLRSDMGRGVERLGAGSRIGVAGQIQRWIMHRRCLGFLLKLFHLGLVLQKQLFVFVACSIDSFLVVL